MNDSLGIWRRKKSKPQWVWKTSQTCLESTHQSIEVKERSGFQRLSLKTREHNALAGTMEAALEMFKARAFTLVLKHEQV